MRNKTNEEKSYMSKVKGFFKWDKVEPKKKSDNEPFRKLKKVDSYWEGGKLRPISMGSNKRGQAMMVGIMMLIMAIVIFVATIPILKSMFDSSRGCEYLNCKGYVDRDCTGSDCGNATRTEGCSASDESYYAPYGEDNMSCTILDLGIPYLILAVLVGLITKFIHGKLVDEESPRGYPY